MFRDWLIKMLLKDREIERAYGSTHLGPFMIIKAPPNWKECAHDADKAVYCNGHIVFCYGETEELRNA